MASLNSDLPLSAALQADLNRLRQLNTQDIQAHWHWQDQDWAIADITATNTLNWPIAPLNDRHHIAWPRGRHIRWLYQSITVPSNLYGYPLAGLTLRLSLTWWADDAQIFINHTLVQSGDLFECFTRLCLSKAVSVGETFQVAIRLISPGHDGGALVRSHLTYELPKHHATPEPSFIADELTVLAILEPTSQLQIQAALSQLDWHSLNHPDPISSQPKSSANALHLWQNLTHTNTPHHLAINAILHPFHQELSQLRRALKPLSTALKQRQIQCIGHAHLDMAWLWPIADTWDAAERTFQSVLNLQQDFPELTYTHSSPALFEWIEHHRPELFRQIQQKVATGHWSIDAGLWIEPELNFISGEAIARQILYAQRYCQEKFDTISTIAWLPDSFGFCWQLPQLLTQGGIETFATLKLSWNDTTEFPHQLFWWQSPDGSRILSLMLPPIGTDIDPIKMATYAAKWEASTGSTNTLWLPGLGDHGGGPTRDMLEKFQRWATSPFFPDLSFTSATQYINALQSAPSSQPSTSALPIWNNELYLELHRGCYTTHADQKRHNRRSEDLLYQAEVFATIAQIAYDSPFPKHPLAQAWKSLLFNQFHDILPGTAISEVFAEADLGWQQIKAIGNHVLSQSLSTITSHIPLPTPPHPQAKAIVVFNALSWPRSEVVTLALDTVKNSS
ncbi:MAG: alpha-mannosidase [Phormidesmis sp. RL_2_1]|nr:alpha-mannosidase [Phormidesmis sp. RL_2_1]